MSWDLDHEANPKSVNPCLDHVNVQPNALELITKPEKIFLKIKTGNGKAKR